MHDARQGTLDALSFLLNRFNALKHWLACAETDSISEISAECAIAFPRAIAASRVAASTVEQIDTGRVPP
jgi:hypothetical protein